MLNSKAGGRLLDTLISKIRSGQRISIAEAEILYLQADEQQLRDLASLARDKWHPTKTATYLIMAIVNYTNVCVAKCDYCSFYRLPHQDGTYLISDEELCQRIQKVVDMGGTMVGLNGGFHPKLRIADYCKTFKSVRSHFGDSLEFYGMTVAEFLFAARVSKLPLHEAAQMLAASGVRWITGGGAEILDDDFRKRHSPGKSTVEQYYEAQQAILDSGLSSTATMVIGFDETLDERLNHLRQLRNFQDQQTNPLKSFLCWTYKPYHNDLGGNEISTQEYLRWLAVCRIYLDNFKHIRTSVLTKNKDALLALEYGADDFDLPTEDEVTEKAGAIISLDFESILDQGRNLGFDLVHRKPFSHEQNADLPRC